jgi:hypothetical protein
MPRPRRDAAFIVAALIGVLAPAAWAAGSRVRAPKTARVGATVTVHATGLITGSYALTLVSDSHPARGASCVARLSKSKVTWSGAVTLRGVIPSQLTCYQGVANALGRVATATGAYHLVIAEPTAPAAFDARGSFIRSALRVTR